MRNIVVEPSHVYKIKVKAFVLSSNYFVHSVISITRFSVSLYSVTISSKEVVVYPDDADKPSEGEGLNKKAVVSLEGNWPVDKSTREAIMDTERIEKMGYANKLQRMTEKIGATFLSYDSTTGVCQFEV